MLDEMPAAAISLNELSRRVGMAKSNVLRYFESREAVLLELSTAATAEWLDEFERILDDTITPGGPPAPRADQLAAAVATSLAEHPVLCDLISEQTGVLEHNISTEAVLRYKKVSVANYERLSGLALYHLPELGPAPTDVVLRRSHGIGPMGGTDLDATLRNLGVSTIVAVGVSVNVAITNLVMDAVNMAYRVVVPRDAVAGIPADYATSIIDNTLSLLATITTTAELIGSWKSRT